MIKRPGKIFFLVILLFLLIGCNTSDTTEKNPEENITLESVTHRRSELSARTYPALATTYNGVSYEIEDICINSESGAMDIITNIDEDVTHVTNYLGGMKTAAPEVLVITKDILDGMDLKQSYHYDNTVITTKEFIENGEYLHALIGAMLDNNIPWINHGLAGQLNDCENIPDEISAFLSNDIDIMDFFGARFFATIDGNNSDEMISIAEAFVDYYIHTYGKDEFFMYITSDNKTSLNKEKNEWLMNLGLEIKYIGDDEISFNDFEVYSKNAVYRIKLNYEEGYLLSSVDNLKYFLRKNALGIQEVKEFFSNTLSDKNLVELEMKPLYDINEAGKPMKVYSNPYENIIVLHVPYIEVGHIHEYVHAVTPINKENMLDGEIDEEYRYFVEGVAGYVTSSINNEYSCNFTDLNTYESKNIYQGWTEKIYNEKLYSTAQPDEQQYIYTKYLEYYERHAKDFNDFTDFNMKLYSDSLSYAIFSLQGKYPNAQVDYNEYALYESFIGYIADEYSVIQIIQVLENYDMLQGIFEKSFSELLAEWKAFLLKS